jgi:hypothetical protein
VAGGASEGGREGQAVNEPTPEEVRDDDYAALSDEYARMERPDPLMDAVADVVAATKPISEVPLHEMWHARPPIERYVLATVDIPGGQVFAGLGYERGELVAGKREHLIGIVSVHASRDAVGGDPVTVGSADDLSQRIERDLSLTFQDRAWFVEIWNEREALTQTYAPWGRPRTR